MLFNNYLNKEPSLKYISTLLLSFSNWDFLQLRTCNSVIHQTKNLIKTTFGGKFPLLVKLQKKGFPKNTKTKVFLLNSIAGDSPTNAFLCRSDEALQLLFSNFLFLVTFVKNRLWSHLQLDGVWKWPHFPGSYKSSHSQMFYKIDVLKNFVKFTGKNLCRSFFLINLHVSHLFWSLFLILIVFPVNFAKFLRTPFFRTPPVAASEANYKFQNKLQVNCGRLAS